MSNMPVLIVEDDVDLREALTDTLELAGYRVASVEDGRAALDFLTENLVGMVISDVNMPRMDGHTLLKNVRKRYPTLPVLIMTAYGSIEKAVEAMHDGAVDYLVKPFEAEVLVHAVSRYLLATDSDEDDEFIAFDEKTTELLKMAKRVADSDASVMITGESGTGKEVLAQFVHRNSPRKEEPFVAINCAAIPNNMLEAILFGYEKGAFTGAYKSSPGKFEIANGGTILLDEISEMELGLQAKILRVLQEREVERLGGNNIIKLDVRVLATSNRDMRLEAAEGGFREDLYYRLNVFPLHLPPLRERPADIFPIAERLLAHHAQRSGHKIPQFSTEVKTSLEECLWPGNVRELDNVMQRALILSDGITVSVKDLHFEPVPAAAPAKAAAVTIDDTQTDRQELPKDVTEEPVSPAESSPQLSLKEQQQQMILDTLREFGGNRKKTAEKLDISERTLRYKLARMRENGIEIP